MNWCQLLHHLSWRQLSKNSTIHFVQNLPSIKLHSDLRYNWSSSQSACGKTLQLEKVLQVLFLADQFPWADLWQWCTIGPCSVFLRQFFTQVATYLSSNRFVVWRRSHKGSASCCLVNQSQAQPSWQPRVVRCCFLGFFWGFFFFFFSTKRATKNSAQWQFKMTAYCSHKRVPSQQYVFNRLFTSDHFNLHHHKLTFSRWEGHCVEPVIWMFWQKDVFVWLRCHLKS